LTTSGLPRRPENSVIPAGRRAAAFEDPLVFGVLYSARAPEEYRAIVARRRDAFTELPLRPEIGERALAVQAGLAGLSQIAPRGVVDLLSAATAEYYGAPVLHYDGDFDHIATVTRQAVEWVVPAGTAN
jgi:predicted nucleic acid-binding protein